MPAEPKLASPAKGRILIVGGYGQVGRAIAARLAPLFPGRVVIAGRDLNRARIVAAELGQGVLARQVDILAAGNETALGGVSLVLVCLDQTDTGFVEQCLSSGVHYVDISADFAFLSRVEQLDGVAKDSAAVAVLSVGVAPGLTNLLAARARRKMDRADRLDVFVELGLGDQHGRAAVEWMLDNLDAEFEVTDRARRVPVRGFGESMEVRWPGDGSKRRAYRFNLSDQHVIGRTLDVPTVSTWLHFDGRIATWLIAKSVQAGLGRLLRRRVLRRFAVWLFMNTHVGSDVCGVAVRVAGRTKDGAESLMLSVLGRKEAQMTAIVAAETVRQVLSQDPVPGVFHSEQVVALDPTIAALKAELPDLVVAL